MLKVLVPSLLFCSLFAVTPALAINGHDAAIKCENTPGCYVDYIGDGVLIFGLKGGMVHCESPKAQCTASKTVPQHPHRASLQLLQSLEAAPETVGKTQPKKKPAMVFNMTDDDNGNSGGGKSGSPTGQGGKPVKNDGGGKSVTPHNFVFVKPHPIS